jgi:hypothetical protein
MSTQTEWPEQYLRECVADEITLAFLHPQFRRRFGAPAALSQSAPIVPVARRGTAMISAGMARLNFSTSQSESPPCWRRNWEAAGDLSLELGLAVIHDPEEGTVSAGTGNRRRNVTERYGDHPSKAAATWAAIVRSAIQELEARAGQ